MSGFTIALQSKGNTVQLLPAGRFAATDGSGRPEGLDGWSVDAATAQRLIAQVEERNLRIPIDYEHQGFLSEKNGQPAPAAGWFRKLEWREGEGLFALDVEWTEKARDMIKAGEYRYISPVFIHDSETGEVTSLLGAGITNNPGLNVLAELMALKAKAGALEPSGAGGEVGAPSRVDSLVRETKETLEALRARTEEALSAQREVTILRQKIANSQIDAVIEDALDGARILPAHVDAARRLAAVDFEALKRLLDRPPLVPALLGMQSSRLSMPNGESHRSRASLSVEEQKICALTGRTHKEFAELKHRFTAEDSGFTD